MQVLLEHPPAENRNRYTALRRSTAMFNEREYWTTLCPEDCSENWFKEEFLDNPEFPDILIQDPDTHDGMKYIAEFYGVGKKWTDTYYPPGGNLMDPNTPSGASFPIYSRQELLLKLIKEEGNEKKFYCLSPWEGMQRKSAMMHFQLGSPIDEFTGYLQPGCLLLQHLDGLAGNIPKRVYDRKVNPVLHSEKVRAECLCENRTTTIVKNKMHNKIVRATISWLNNPNTNADDACRHFRVKSDNAAFVKHRSAKKETSERLYADYHALFGRAKESNLLFRPNYTDQPGFEQRYQKYLDNNAVQAMVDDSSIDNTLATLVHSPFIQSSLYQSYLRNPKDDSIRERVIRKLATPSFKWDRLQISEIPENVTYPQIQPPFPPTMEMMAGDSIVENRGNPAKLCGRICGTTANAAVLSPPLILSCHMASKNMSEEEALNDPELFQIQQYFANFCLHNNPQPNNVDLHGAWNAIYRLGNQKHTHQRGAHIIGAVMFINEMISSTFAHKLQNNKTTIGERVQTYKETKDMLGSTILMMGSNKTMSQSDDEWIQTLGKHIMYTKYIFYVHSHT